jgi:long-chain acyl-CoA synthetase
MAPILIGEQECSPGAFDLRTRQAAAGLAGLGLGPGDTVALLLRNDIPFLEASVAAGLLGACPVPLNWHSTAAEAAYVVGDCAATVLIAHTDLYPGVADTLPPGLPVLLVRTPPEIAQAYGLAAAPAETRDERDWDAFLARQDPWSAPACAPPGAIIYTSGTTGKPKGVRRAAPSAEQAAGVARLIGQAYGLAPRPTPTVSLVTAPLYHSAPNMHAMTGLRIGAKLILQPRFDPEATLALIERHAVTHAYFAPIMFHRLLRLPPEVRARYDLGSLEFVVHAAAPCPAEVKRAMVDWWGPVIHEFYGSTETRAVTGCGSREWLDHPGTVGRRFAGAVLHELDAEGRDCPAMVPGEVVCGHPGLADFTYQGDDASRRAADRAGLIATGDIGYLNQAGYLFICDRKTDMIISGGVNIYPAEIEAELADLPGVSDCAVFGIPDAEFGEAVMAVVQSADGRPLDLAALQAALRARLSGYKVPRRIEQLASLPREDSGKIFKRKLRDAYWTDAAQRI